MNDYIFNFANKAISVVAGLAMAVILARYLGVELRGEYSFVTQAASLAGLALSLGIGQTFHYYYRKSDRYYDLCLCISICVCILAFGAAGVVVLVRGIDVLTLVAVLAPLIMLYQQFESFMAAINIRLKVKTNMILSLIRVAALIGVVLVADQPSLVMALIPLVLAWVTAIVVYVSRVGLPVRARIKVDRVSSVIRFSFVPLVTALLVILNYNLDLLLLRALGSAQDLGLYAVAVGLVTYMWVIADAIKEVLVSRVVRSEGVTAALQPLRFAVSLTAIVIGVFWLIGRPVISTLFGSEFDGAYLLTVVLSIGALGLVYYKVLGVVALAHGRRAFYFWTLATAVVTNGLLNYWLIPDYGAIGAAWATVVSYTLTAVAFVLFISRKYDVAVVRMFLATRGDLAHGVQIVRRAGPWKKK